MADILDECCTDVQAVEGVQSSVGGGGVCCVKTVSSSFIRQRFFVENAEGRGRDFWWTFEGLTRPGAGFHGRTFPEVKNPDT